MHFHILQSQTTIMLLVRVISCVVDQKLITNGVSCVILKHVSFHIAIYRWNILSSVVLYAELCMYWFLFVLFQGDLQANTLRVGHEMLNSNTTARHHRRVIVELTWRILSSDYISCYVNPGGMIAYLHFSMPYDIHDHTGQSFLVDMKQETE